MKATVFAGTALATALLAMSAPAVAASAASTADDSVTWSVSPANSKGDDGRSWVETKLEPGEESTEYIAVSNLGPKEATFVLSAADGYFTKTGRFNMLQAGEVSVDAGTWISVAHDVSIAPGATEVVPFTITVPENATPGDHAAGIAASVMSEGATSDGARIGVESRVGFRVMTQVTGELEPALTVSNLASEYSPSWNPFAPGEVSLSYEVTNSGNTQLSFGEKIDGTTTNRGDLFPGESRRVSTDPITAWPLGLVSKDITVTGTVPSDATIEVASVSQSVAFWAIPWMQLAILGALIAVILGIVVARRRSSSRLADLLEQARAEGRREHSETVLS